MLIAAVAGLVVVACGDEPQRGPWETLTEEEASQRISDLTAEISREPEDPDPYVERGDIYLFHAEDFHAAIEDYDRAIELDNRHFWAYVGRGISYFERGFLNSALEDFEVALSIDPDQPYAHTLRGLSHWCRSRTAEAIAAFDRAIELDPDDFLAHLYRGIAYRETRKFDLAVSDLDRAEDLNPTDPDVYWVRGQIQYDLSNYAAALADFSTVSVHREDFALVHLRKGDANYQLGNHNRAVLDYIEYFRRFPVSIRGVHPNFNLARQALTEEIERNSENAAALRSRALLYAMGQGRHRAWADFDKAVELEPEHAETYFYRAIYRVDPGYEPDPDILQKIRADYERATESGLDLTDCRAMEPCAEALSFLEEWLE